MTGIAVVGLHRGGTSAVAGVLHHLGVFMGDDLLPPSEHNPRGYFEDRKFVEAHTAMMGGDWKSPKSLNFNENITREQYSELVAEMMEHELWGIKDPRLCYCLPALIQMLPEDYDLRIIGVYRDMMGAMQSLYARGGHDWGEARDITIRYMRVMLRTLNDCGKEYSLLHFPTFVWCPDTVSTFAEQLGIDATPKQISTAAGFLDPNLVHWGRPDEYCDAA